MSSDMKSEFRTQISIGVKQIKHWENVEICNNPIDSAIIFMIELGPKET